MSDHIIKLIWTGNRKSFPISYNTKTFEIYHLVLMINSFNLISTLSGIDNNLSWPVKTPDSV